MCGLGALVLLGGLMSGPTPEGDVAAALRDIDGFRTRYVITNLVDFAGATIMVVGLLMLANLRARSAGGSLLATLGGLGVAIGGALFLLVLLIESVVHPAIAAQYMGAPQTQQEGYLVAGQAMMALDAAIFGVAFMLMMAGIAAVLGALLARESPAVNRLVLWAGIAMAALASPSAIAYLFEPTRGFGALEPLFGLAVLVCLVILGALLWRAASRD